MIYCIFFKMQKYTFFAVCCKKIDSIIQQVINRCLVVVECRGECLFLRGGVLLFGKQFCGDSVGVKQSFWGGYEAVGVSYQEGA